MSRNQILKLNFFILHLNILMVIVGATPCFLQAAETGRPFIQFIGRQQARMTEAYASATNDPLCAPMTLEERKAFSEKGLKCFSFSKDDSPLQDMNVLDEIYFHQKSIQLKEVINCKKINIDCFLAQKNELKNVADYYLTSDLSYVKLFLKTLTGSLNPEEKSKIDGIVDDSTILKIIPMNQMCKTRSKMSPFFRSDPTVKTKTKPSNQDCFNEIKAYFKLTVYNGYVTRQLDDFIDNQKRLDLLTEIAENPTNSSKCQAHELIYSKLRQGLTTSRHRFDDEENKIARSCVRSEVDGTCVYKPTFESKHYLINVGHPIAVEVGKTTADSENLDPNTVEKYLCHLNRTYGKPYDELNNDLKGKVIPIFDLVLYWRTFFGGILKKIIIEQPSMALTLAHLSQNNALKSPLLKGIGKLGSKAADVILVSGALIETSRISQACVKKLHSMAGTGVSTVWDTQNCSCKNQHISPIEDKAAGDCQAEVIKMAINDSLAPLMALKRSLFFIDSVQEEGIPQAFDSFLDQNLSNSMNQFKNLVQPEKIAQIESFLKKYEAESAECP